MPDTTSEAPLIGERIVVIGNTNSGKSTLAAQLAELIGGKHVELVLKVHYVRGRRAPQAVWIDPTVVWNR